MTYGKAGRSLGLLAALSAQPAVAAEAFVPQMPVREAQRMLGAVRSAASDQLSVPVPIASIMPSFPKMDQNGRLPSGNTSYVMQNGSANTAAVMQTGSQNLSAILQQGRGNNATVVQSNTSR